jgi:hypothetical protein
MTEKKSNEPELIEDTELDEMSGGTEASGLRSGTDQQQAAGWPSKIAVGGFKEDSNG